MANLTGNPKTFKNALRQLETTDPKHPDTWNPNYQTLIDNDAYLKERADLVDQAKGDKSSLPERLTDIERTQQMLDVDYQNAEAAALKFALDQAALANYTARALREQIQQEGEVTIANRGVISGCSVTRSTTAARNLNLANGVCFAKGRAFSVTPGNNAASVPSNTGSGAVTVYAYLFQNDGGIWRLAVTPIGSAVPADAIVIYNVTVPPGSTDASDPNLVNVTITDVRRIEPHFPQLVDSPATVSPMLNTLRANDYQLSLDVVSAVGAPCGASSIHVTSRATNGFTLLLASAADSVVVRWRVSKLNN